MTSDDAYHRWVERLKETLNEDESKARETPGKRLPGLVRRRKMEADLYFS